MGGTPAEGTPAEGTPAEDTPAGGTPAEGIPAEGTPAGGTFVALLQPPWALAPDMQGMPEKNRLDSHALHLHAHYTCVIIVLT